MTVQNGRRWNHNIHYHPRILCAILPPRREGPWEHPSPKVWPPPVTYPQMRALAAEILPGSQYRRHLLWRYSITWRKPQE